MSERWLSREDCIDHVRANYKETLARTKVAVRAALAGDFVHRRGYPSDTYRLSEMEHGEPDLGAGPSEPFLPFSLDRRGRRPGRWIETNKFQRIEYSVEELDREIRDIWGPPPPSIEDAATAEAPAAASTPVKKKTYQETIELLRDKMIADPRGAREWLRDRRDVLDKHIQPAIDTLANEGLRSLPGRPKGK